MSLKIYYLDDEVDLLEMFSDLFEAPGRDIRTFSNPRTAIEAIRLDPPDILFIDYRLPRFTGDQIAVELNPAFPVILITGDMQVHCAFAFTAVFGKPYPAAEIEALLTARARSLAA